jgi:hypothetical protein
MKHTTTHLSPAPADLATEFQDRLVTLSDGRSGLRGGLPAEIRSPDASESGGAAVIEFTASNSTVDRYGETIEASGWHLEAYRRNPVFQNAHQYGDILFTLGRALVTEVRGNTLFQSVEFAVGVNPMARIAYGLYRGHFLNAVSVGFLPIRWENGGENSPWRRRHLEQELVEVSAVGIPANPDALQMGLRAGAIERSDLRDLLDAISGVLQAGSQSGAQNNGGSHNLYGMDFPGSVSRETQLLQLARAVREIMRRS